MTQERNYLSTRSDYLPPLEEPLPQPFDIYNYHEDIEIGRIKGRLSIHTTTREGWEKNISALAFFFNDQELSLASAPIIAEFKLNSSAGINEKQTSPAFVRQIIQKLRTRYKIHMHKVLQSREKAIVFSSTIRDRKN